VKERGSAIRYVGLYELFKQFTSKKQEFLKEFGKHSVRTYRLKALKDMLFSTEVIRQRS
jgi:hypothetical protein